jgi:hypothetical protein
MAITQPTNLDYLIMPLRLHLGDIDSTQYRYLDEWLRTALVMAVKNLERWWSYKYLLNYTTYNVYRNTQSTFFYFAEPPVVEVGDEYPIVLMASMIIKGGQLENSAWNTASWRDAEISYSNIEGSRARRESLEADRKALEEYLKPPQKRLALTKKNHLPGYKFNPNERDTNEPA